jgi:hypothetical protein
MKMGSENRALDKIYKRRDRYEIPEWQRDEVWTDDRKQLLIDTILRGWKIPKFYFAKVSAAPEEFEVVDGQQRLMAIFEFFDGLLTLSPDTAHRVGAETYEELPDHIADAFDDYEIAYDEITDWTEEELKEYFRRLQFGLSLTASEQLHAVHSNLTDFARQLSKHNFFKEKVWIGDTRKAHFDIAAKVAAIAIDGIDTGLRLADLTKTFLANEKFSSDSNIGKVLTATFDLLDRTFPERDPMLRNRSTIQSIATIASRLVERKSNPGYEAQFLGFCQHFGKELAAQIERGHKATDPDYIEFQRTISANIKAGARIRHEILLRKMLLFDPSFMGILSPDSVVASKMNTDIMRLGNSVGALIEKVNDSYSSREGSDLFKATNKTAAAINRLSEPISDFESYKILIDDLYFVFREGVGSRLAGKEPDSFVDVNSLRTALQHDVDHGKAKDVAAKKKKLGDAFKKYGGVSAPSGEDPAHFPVIQANVLGALEADLKGLL